MLKWHQLWPCVTPRAWPGCFFNISIYLKTCSYLLVRDAPSPSRILPAPSPWDPPLIQGALLLFMWEWCLQAKDCGPGMFTAATVSLLAGRVSLESKEIQVCINPRTYTQLCLCTYINVDTLLLLIQAPKVHFNQIFLLPPIRTLNLIVYSIFISLVNSNRHIGSFRWWSHVPEILLLEDNPSMIWCYSVSTARFIC